MKAYAEKQLNTEETNRLNNLVQLINGFTSELSLEILSTTAYILDANPNCSFEEVLNAIGEWSIRKRKLFKEAYVRTAYEHLMKYREISIN